MIKRRVKQLLSFLFVPYLYLRPNINQILGYAHLMKVRDRGVRCIIEGDGYIYNYKNVHLGDDVYIGRNFFIKADDSVFIGRSSHISRNVVIHTSNHNYRGELLPYDRSLERKSVVIGDYVWIGMNVKILPGVSIGNGAIVGMGATVSKDVKENEIVVSPRFRSLGYRDSDHVLRLTRSNAFLTNYES